MKKFYDWSKDSSLKILRENHNYYDVLINNLQNKGKGNAAKNALEKANGIYITFQDADLKYDPQDFNKFINIFFKLCFLKKPIFLLIESCYT